MQSEGWGVGLRGKGATNSKQEEKKRKFMVSVMRYPYGPEVVLVEDDFFLFCFFF